jgi:class 3 adenylate cyclase
MKLYINIRNLISNPIIFYLKILLSISILLSCNQNLTTKLESPIAEKGILDLRAWDFEKNGSINLNGEWEFFWNENIIEAKEKSNYQLTEDLENNLSEPNSNLARDFIYVPGKWNGFETSKGNILSGEGSASFRLKILLPEQKNDLAFRIEDGQGSAYFLYIDGKLLAKNGKPSQDPSLESVIYIPQYNSIDTKNNTAIDLVLFISNHVHRNGGFQTPIEIDTSERIYASKDRNYFLQIFLLGVLMIISLYHLSLFFYRNKDKSALWFGILCLIMAFRLVITGERMFMLAFPNLPFEIMLRLEYFSYYGLVPPFWLFLHSLFSQELSKLIYRILFIIPLVFIAIVILTPIKIFTYTLAPFQLLTLITMVCITFALIQAVRFKRKGSRLILLGFTIYFLAALNDLLFYNYLTGYGLILPYGLFFFIFTQAGALAHRIADAFNTSEELSTVLEEKVQNRTKDLEATKAEIEELNHFTSKINSQIDLDSILHELSGHLYSKYGIIGSWLLLPNESKEFLQASRFRSFVEVDKKVKDFLTQKIVPIQKEGGFIFKVYERGRALFLRKIPSYEYPIDKEIVENIGFNAFLLVPLMRNRQCIGILCFTNFRNEMQIAKSDIIKISNLCSQIAGTIDNNHLISLVQKEKDIANKSKLESEKQKKFTENLNQLIKNLNEDLNLEMIMDKVFHYVKTNYNIDYYGLGVLDKTGNNLVPIISKVPDFVSAKEKVQLGNILIPVQQEVGTHSLAFSHKRPIYAQRIRKSALSPEEDYLHKLLKFESLIVIPLILHNKPIGFLDLYNLGKLKISKEEITYLSILGEQLAGIIYSSNLYNEVQQERQKSDKLLENILPKKIAEELKKTDSVKPQLIESATVLFTDFVGFTQISERLTPEELISELDGCFSQFDEVVAHNNLEKLKTIGDAYMCAGGLPVPNNTHVIDVCLAAMEFRSFMLQMGEIKKALSLPFWELRIGIHTGPVTAGVIGNNKFTYDIWGDTVNTASRMESSGEKGKINISNETYEYIKDFFVCEFRGKINAKGKGNVDMYFLLRLKPEYSIDNDGLVPNSDFITMKENLQKENASLELSSRHA